MASLCTLPPDVLDDIGGYLDVPSLARAECVCSHLRDMYGRQETWSRALAWGLSFVSAEQRLLHGSDPALKTAFRTKLADSRHRTSQARNRATKAVARREKIQKDVSISLKAHYSVLTPATLLCAVAPFITLLLLTRKLDGLDLRWWTVFIPLWTAIVAVFVGGCTSIYLWRSRDQPDGSVNAFDQSMFRTVPQLWSNGEHSRAAMWCLVAVLLLVLIWLILIPAKLEDVLHANWRSVFAPFWTAAGLLCLVPRIQDKVMAVCVMWFCSVGWWLLAVTVTLTTMADTHNMSIVVALTPIWIQCGGFVVFGSCAACIMYFKMSHRMRPSLLQVAVVVTLGIIAFGLIVLPVLLVTLKLSTGLSVSYSKAFIPYHIILAVSAVYFTKRALVATKDLKLQHTMFTTRNPHTWRGGSLTGPDMFSQDNLESV